MARISDCCLPTLQISCCEMKLVGTICKLDRFLDNWLIVQPPGQFATWPDWQIGRNRYKSILHLTHITHNNRKRQTSHYFRPVQFHPVGTICKLDRFLDNWQIVQRNLQIGRPICQLAGWPGKFAKWPDWQIGRANSQSGQIGRLDGT